VTTAASPPSTTSPASADPFAKLASGLLDAAPAQSQRSRKKTDKTDFFPEPSKPTLSHLSQQQQQRQQEESDTQQVQQQANFDIFGATPVSITSDQWRRDEFKSGGTGTRPMHSAGKNFFVVPHHFFWLYKHNSSFW